MKFIFPFISIFLLLSGCTATGPINDVTKGYSSNIQQRNNILAQLTSWEIKGKIAFINEAERQSASLYWQKTHNNQQVNLTTYLGINVFKLTSEKNTHTVAIDGNEYTSRNLDELLSSLTEFAFPTQALSFWIKATQYNKNDAFTYEPNTQLPSTLTSHYNNTDWVIHYTSYQTVKQNNITVALPNKIKVTSPNLTINIVINQWTIA